MIWNWVYSAAVLSGCVAAIIFSFVVRREAARGLLISFSIVIAMLAASDVYIRAGDPPLLTERTFAPGYHVADGEIGKHPPPPGPYRVVSRLKETGEIVYDVTYTIASDGFRKTEGAAAGSDTILFFGGSYTYGEGVDDNETYPAQFSRALDYRYRVVNFGFSGYGPHQMLWLLESGKADASVEGPVVAAYYLIIDNHMNRAAGLHWWSIGSPRYVLDARGDLRPDGLHKSNGVASFLAELEYQRGLAGQLSRGLAEILVPREARLDVTAAIIRKSAALIRREYGAELYCLFWGNHLSRDFSLLAQNLEEGGIKVLRIADFDLDLSAAAVGILPGIENHPGPAFYNSLGTALAHFHRSTVRSQSRAKQKSDGGLE